MKNGGIIFDFNGTLFWDTAYHEIAWDEYLDSNNFYLSGTQKKEFIHGRSAKDILEFLFKKKLSASEIERYTEEKEEIYRNECLKHRMLLAPGAVNLLEYLNEHDVPIAIATSAEIRNVQFFIEQFNLLSYFKEEHIIYNDGKIRGKPYPDIFDKAIRRLKVNKADTIILEDSFSGIKAAINCHVGHVIIVNSNQEDFSSFNLPVIDHFDQFNRDIIPLPVRK